MIVCVVQYIHYLYVQHCTYVCIMCTYLMMKSYMAGLQYLVHYTVYRPHSFADNF